MATVINPYVTIDAPYHGNAFAVSSNLRTTKLLTSGDAVGCGSDLGGECPAYVYGNMVYVRFSDRPSIRYPAMVGVQLDKKTQIITLTVERGEIPTVPLGADSVSLGDLVSTGGCGGSSESGYVASIAPGGATMRTSLAVSSKTSGCPILSANRLVGIITGDSASGTVPGPLTIDPMFFIARRNVSTDTPELVAQATAELMNGSFFELPVATPPPHPLPPMINESTFEIAASALCAKAGADDANAAYGCAEAFITGHGAPKDLDRALPLLERAAAAHVEKAEAALPGLRDDVARNHATAAKDMAAANAGDAVGMDALGSDYYLGMGVPQDPALSVYWYQSAANLGNADARDRLAHQIFLGFFGPLVAYTPAPTPPPGATADQLLAAARSLESAYKFDEAAPLYIRAAKSGEAKISYFAAAFFSHNPKIAHDNDVDPNTYLTEALNMGYWKARWLNIFDKPLQLASSFAKPDTTMSEDIIAAMQATLKIANAGDADAQAFVAITYLNGRPGIPRNCTEGLEWAKRAVAQGDQGALYDEGGPADSLIYGLTRKNELSVLAETIAGPAPRVLGPCLEGKDAISVLTAIGQIHGASGSAARTRLADLYERGIIVPLDRDKAVYWYRLNAKEGDVSAMQWLRLSNVGSQ